MSRPTDDVAELLATIEQLDADNERLRMRVLEVMEWMEEAVTEQVATERELAACRERSAELAADCLGVPSNDDGGSDAERPPRSTSR